MITGTHWISFAGAHFFSFISVKVYVLGFESVWFVFFRVNIRSLFIMTLSNYSLILVYLYHIYLKTCVITLVEIKDRVSLATITHACFSCDWNFYCVRFQTHSTTDIVGISSEIANSNIHGANMGPTWVLSAPDGPHVGPMNLSIWGWMPYDPIADIQARFWLTIS